MSLVLMEDIGFNAGGSGDQVIDYLRTGLNDRSYNPTSGQVWGAGGSFSWKQTDFISYFSGDENKIEGSNKDEGIIIRIIREMGELSTVDWLSLQIHYMGGAQ